MIFSLSIRDLKGWSIFGIDFPVFLALRADLRFTIQVTGL